MMLFRVLFDGTMMSRRRSTGTPRKQGRRGSKATNQGQARDPPLREDKKDETTQRHFARATTRKATLEPGQPRTAEALVDTIPPSVHLVDHQNCFYFKGMKVRHHH
jgi:hypothetical protein